MTPNSSLASVQDDNHVGGPPLTDEEKAKLEMHDEAMKRLEALKKSVLEQRDLINRLSEATSSAYHHEEKSTFKYLSKGQRNKLMTEITTTSAAIEEISHVIIRILKSSKRVQISEDALDTLLEQGYIGR